MKTRHFEVAAFVAVVAGALLAWCYADMPALQPFGFWVVLVVAGCLWCVRQRPSVVLMLVPVGAILGVSAVGAHMARLRQVRPVPADAGRVFLIEGTVREIRTTAHGAVLVVRRPHFIRPQVPFRLRRLAVYVPEPPPDWADLKVRVWIRLKTSTPPYTVPHPMRRLQERHLPRFVGSATSPRLMTYQGRPRVSSGLNPANRELVGLFLRNGAVPIWRERLGWMGLGHLLSISGLHCGLVWLLLKWLLAWVRSPARRTGAACCGMLLFATHMGWQDSVARATLFLLVFQVLWAVGRRRCWLRVWSVLTAVSVLLDPTCLLRQGFWYSYAVSLGLVVGLGPGVVRSPLVHPWSPRLRWLRALAAAQLFALPVGLLFGVRLNWAAFFWNMAGFPLLLGLLGLFVWAMAGLVSPRCAWVVNSLDEHIAGWFQVMRQSEGLLCEVRFPWEPAVVVLALVLLFCALHYGGRERRWVLCLVLVAAGRCHQTPLQGARMVVLDVGQGSCALLVAENGEGWLLDAGGRLPPFITFEQVLRLYGVRRVRGGLVSHFNRDHYAFLETMDPGVPFWVPAAQLPLFVGHPLLGERRWLGVEAGVRETVGAMQVRLLWPQAGRPAVNANEGSLVALVGVPGGIVLVPGDAGVLSESYWDLPPPQAQQRVLVLGHHGSRSATGTPLLRRFQPDLAVVSCGRNNAFGHPHPTVVARLGRFGVKTWVTAERGTVTLWRREEP